jgi:hypothetical protein
MINMEFLPVTVDKSHLITIGERLYSESIELIRELVNNAYDADAKDCHGHPVLMGWKCFEKDGLGDGLKGTSSDALEDPEKYEALEVPCRTAEQ